MFVCQLTQVFKSVFRKNFVEISSIDFFEGSVIVNSVVQLSKPPSDEDLDKTKVGVTNTFADNGFVIDQFNLEKAPGSYAVCLCYRT